MSASPSGLPNGQASGQNAKPLPPQLRRRPRPVDPLVARKKPLPKPTGSQPPSSGAAAPRTASPASGPPGVRPGRPLPGSAQDVANLEALRRKFGGWSQPPPAQYADFAIVTTKRALRDGIRHHMMRFHQPNPNDKPVDPTDKEEFTRPVTLQRRDPKQPPPGRVVKEEEPAPRPPEDEKEAERIAQLKAERDAQRAIDQAKIAPGSKEPAPKRPQKKEKDKPTQFHRVPRTEQQRKEADLRYEEALPWHLEDADGKNVWVGQYVAQLSETNVAFVIDGGNFRMIPLEKAYRMIAKPPFKPYSIEEAENLMKDSKRGGGMARWGFLHNQKLQAEKDLAQTRSFIGGRSRVTGESRTFKSASREEKQDHDELDISADEFQDDDENPGMEFDQDEDNKEAMDRVRRNQLGANLFGDADEQEVDKEEEEIKREAQERQKFGKKVLKALIRKELNKSYVSDKSDSDPFASSSSDEEDDDDAAKVDSKEEDEDKDKGEAKADVKDAAPSGASSKGNTTPSGKGKATDNAKKGKSLKRPGSPMLSESSGNESSRKKVKKSAKSVQQSRSSTPLPPSQRLKGGVGSGSDGEGTAGEMSDGQPKKKKIKLLNPNVKGSPAGSRAGSPIPSGSVNASPSKDGASPRAGSPVASGAIDAAEISAAIPASGITIGNLLKAFEGRVGDDAGQMSRKDWIALIKNVTVYGADKLLRRK